jgi:hypothetical protein
MPTLKEKPFTQEQLESSVETKFMCRALILVNMLEDPPESASVSKESTIRKFERPSTGIKKKRDNLRYNLGLNSVRGQVDTLLFDALDVPESERDLLFDKLSTRHMQESIELQMMYHTLNVRLSDLSKEQEEALMRKIVRE